MITHLKLKYLGSKIPRTFKLPIPFLSKSDDRGQVVCDPIGEFPVEDGRFLLGLGTDQFELIEEVDDGLTEEDAKQQGEMPLCACHCGKRLEWKKQYKYQEVPKFLNGHNAKLERSIADNRMTKES